MLIAPAERITSLVALIARMVARDEYVRSSKRARRDSTHMRRIVRLQHRKRQAILLAYRAQFG